MKRVVIIGGGFAGSTVAKKLIGKCSITFIDTKDFFEYTPGILRVLTQPEHYEELHIKHKEYLQNEKIIIGLVKKIEDNTVILSNGKKIKYDYLVIASGSSYNSPIKEKNTFFANRLNHLLEANKKIVKSKTIAIVGGGIVGVELASELATHYKDKVISLIHSHSKLMERNNVKSGEYARKFLEKNGVKLIFDEKIIKTEKKELVGKSGVRYPYDSVFFTVGITTNTNFMVNEFSKFVSRGIIVNDFLQLIDNPNIFVAGDVSNIVEEKTAQNAEMHGETVAHNVISLIEGRQLKQYKSKKRIMVISLGKYSGIIEYKKFAITGIIPAILKKIIEKKVMWSF